MMTPIPAVVTVDAAETVEAALRRCVTSGHTRLVVIEDDNPDRVKGIVHNNSLARLYMSDGPEAAIESARPRRPDRAGDAPARRPPARPPGPAHLALGRRRRVRAHGRDRHRRGHPRGGGGGDRGRDRPPRRRPAPAHQRRLVRPRPRLARRPRRRRDRAAGRHRRLQLGRRLRLRRARAAAQARRLDHRQRLHDPGRGGAREPDRGGADQRSAVPSVPPPSFSGQPAPRRTLEVPHVGCALERQAARGPEGAAALRGTPRPGAQRLDRGPRPRPLGRAPRGRAALGGDRDRSPAARASPRPT